MNERSALPDDGIQLRRALTSGLLVAGRHWRRAANAVVRTHGLSEATAFPLVLIGRAAGELRQTALAEAAGLEGPSLVRLLDQLCAAGLAVRREDPTDGRAKIITLTAKGRRLVEVIEAELSALRDTVFAGVSPDDIAAGLRLFEALAHHVGAAGARPEAGR